MRVQASACEMALCMCLPNCKEPDKRHLLKTRDLDSKSHALLKPEDIQASCCSAV